MIPIEIPKPRQFKREIICAYKNFKEIKPKYPRREVIADMHVMADEFYYFGRNGHVRRVKMSDGSIWAQIWEELWEGFSFPTVMQRRIR